MSKKSILNYNKKKAFTEELCKRLELCKDVFRIDCFNTNTIRTK